MACVPVLTIDTICLFPVSSVTSTRCARASVWLFENLEGCSYSRSLTRPILGPFVHHGEVMSISSMRPNRRVRGLNGLRDFSGEVLSLFRAVHEAVAGVRREGGSIGSKKNQEDR